MQAPEGFHNLVRGLHQDAWLIAGGDFDRLVDNCLGCVPPDQKADLARFLAASLERWTAAELRGVIKREKPDIALDSKRARVFFELALQRLREDGC